MTKIRANHWRELNKLIEMGVHIEEIGTWISGTCTSASCMHVSHDARYQHPVVEIEAVKIASEIREGDIDRDVDTYLAPNGVMFEFFPHNGEIRAEVLVAKGRK